MQYDPMALAQLQLAQQQQHQLAAMLQQAGIGTANLFEYGYAPGLDLTGQLFSRC